MANRIILLYYMKEDEQHVSFDGQALGKALGTRPATVHDVAYGEGQLFSAGHGAARLDVFPRSGVTRLTATDLRVELFGTADAAVSDTGVEFHHSQPDQQASLTVLPGGGVVFTFLAGAERTPTSAPPQAGPEPVQLPEQGLEIARKPAPEPASPSSSSGPPPRAEAPNAPLTTPAGPSGDRVTNHPAVLHCHHRAHAAADTATATRSGARASPPGAADRTLRPGPHLPHHRQDRHPGRPLPAGRTP